MERKTGEAFTRMIAELVERRRAAIAAISAEYDKIEYGRRNLLLCVKSVYRKRRCSEV